MTRVFAFVSIAALASAAVAQAAQAPPQRISMDTALEGARAAVDTCKGNGYNVTAMVMDANQIPIVVLRNGAGPGTVEVARKKGYTVLKTGMSSLKFGESINFTPPPPLPPGSPPRPPLVVNGDANLTPFGGGVALKAGTETVGALSVSGAPGGDKDNVCAEAGAGKMAASLK
jgi:uncharacterized protein GlcG (DUF336 family)